MPLFDQPPLIDFSSFQSTLQKDLELVSTLHESEYNAPLITNYTTAMQNIFYISATITIAFVLLMIALRNTSKVRGGGTSPSNLPDERKLHIAYQATNLCVNLILGLYGIYHYNFTLPSMNDLTVTERIVGFDHNLMFICSQIGYNLWSLPVGYFFMNETAAMMGHHIATITVSLISGLSTTGFRYHTVFFFGLIEISSVPLAVMNFCKNNKDLAQEYCPTVRDIIRPIFAAMFLTTRVLMWTPNMRDVLRSAMMLLWTSPSWFTSIVLFLFILSASFLTFLQFFWGYKIVKGIADKLQSMKKVKTL